MEALVETIGEHPFDVDEQGRLRTRIATLFVTERVLWTKHPPFHWGQREAFIAQLNERRATAGLPPLSEAEEEAVRQSAVDLILAPDSIQVRPNPERMDLAFEADELLQTVVSKRQIKFLLVNLPAVREAIEQRGERWRICSVPKAERDRHQLVFESRVALFRDPIYFYNAETGTRWLTYDTFCRLGAREDEELSGYLQEIADHCARTNRLGRPELDFFAVDVGPFGASRFKGIPFATLSAEELRARYERLKDHFRSAVLEPFRADDAHLRPWFHRMFETLFMDGHDDVTGHLQEGFGQEFKLEVEWLPGGRFEEGEFLVDPMFEEARRNPQDASLRALCDPCLQPIIYNLLREYGDVEYINVGRVPNTLSQRELEQKRTRGRRGVYVVVFRSRSEAKVIKRFIRLQKWGVREHLDEGRDLLFAINKSEEYTDFWLDRRLGCRQLGMNLTCRVVMRRMREIYPGHGGNYVDQPIHTNYFEREFLEGTATDKIPVECYSRPGYAVLLARLLGQAAAPSMIVGRSLDEGKVPVFDDGDEVLREKDDLPDEIYVADHSGAFMEWEKPLLTYASYYVKPVNRRDKYVPDLKAFAAAYLEAFRAQFAHVQHDYRIRRRAFDTMFRHTHNDRGSFADRWELVLKRLDATDLDELVAEMRRHIYAFGLPRAA